MPEFQGEFYNVSEKYTLYDTIAITGNLASLSRQPPGWFATFAAFSAGQHSFFNVRNQGNCEPAYCNLDSRDQTAYAFRIESIGMSWWAEVWSFYNTSAPVLRYNMPSAFWQHDCPIESAATLKVQQDEKLKVNSMMLSPGYGPTGGGYGENCAGAYGTTITGQYPILLAETQGRPNFKDAPYRFPNKIDVPRRAYITVELSLTQYLQAALAVIPGPGFIPIWNEGAFDTHTAYLMFGVTCTLNGERLVQQRGALHA